MREVSCLARAWAPEPRDGGAGDGTIFDYGTSTSPGSIESTQHAFECHGADDGEHAALVEALQAGAARSSL